MGRVPGERESRRIFDSAPGGYRDTSLTGPESAAAIRKGLANGKWYTPQIERATLKRLSRRDDWHALRDTAVLFGILAATGYGSVLAWRAGRALPFAALFLTYCVFYTSSGDSRWHECGHGTAFKTRWLNDALYHLASFMVFREPHVWRFSHARHHTDTDVVGRDPEIDARPLDMWSLGLAFFNVQGIRAESAKLWMHARGRMSAAERSFVPASEWPLVYAQARLWLAIYAAVLAVSVALRTPLPAMFVFLPYCLGAWHFVLVGVFQHASLEHDVLDHRLNTRSCLINPVSAFIYWNMHYHVEHHIFPQVPYHALPELHRVLRPQLPKPYGSIAEVYREMIPALRRQSEAPHTVVDGRVVAGPEYFHDRRGDLPPPPPAPRSERRTAAAAVDDQGWAEVCRVAELPPGEVEQFDAGGASYCIYHAEDDDGFYATAGKCTHGAAALADGLVTGNLIECPKHNGCFDFKTGLPKRLVRKGAALPPPPPPHPPQARQGEAAHLPHARGGRRGERAGAPGRQVHPLRVEPPCRKIVRR